MCLEDGLCNVPSFEAYWEAVNELPDTGDDEEDSEEVMGDSRNDDGSVEENESPEEDDEGDDEVDKLKSEVADLKATPRNKCARIKYDAKLMDKRHEERMAILGDYVDLERKIRDLQSKLARTSAQLATALEGHCGGDPSSSRSLSCRQVEGERT